MAGAHAVLVIGSDSVAAAHAAIGIARSQAETRRVAGGDRVGEVPPLQSLVTGDDPHGIVDSFLYGISLNRIARPVGDGGNLFVLPSGTEPVLTEDVFRNDRWRRLAIGFREAGALLLLVAPASATGVEDLAAAVDGVIVVGDAGTVVLPADRVLATVPTPRRLARAATPPRALDLVPSRERIIRPDDADGATAPAAAAEESEGRGWILPTILAAIILALLGFWLTRAATRELREGRSSRDTAAAAADTAAVAPTPTTGAIAAPGSAPAAGAAAAAGAGAAAGDPRAAITPANPGDSAAAAAYAVLVLTANSVTSANSKVAQGGARFPAATVAPVLLGSDSTRWYRVFAGAYATSRQADSLLAALRSQRLVAPGAGGVVRAPYALLVERSVSRDAAKALASGYAGRGIPVYALLQPDGSAQLYAGAFERPERAALLAGTLRAAGISPTLVYRTGRVF